MPVCVCHGEGNPTILRLYTNGVHERHVGQPAQVRAQPPLLLERQIQRVTVRILDRGRQPDGIGIKGFIHHHSEAERTSLFSRRR